MIQRTGGFFAAVSILSVLAAASVFSTACRAQAANVEEYSSYTGTAEGQQDHQFLFGETHLLMHHGGKLVKRVVLYTCRDGSPFARKTSEYDAPWAPDFLLEDVSTGMREGVRSEAGARQVFFRAGRGDRERSRDLSQAPELVVDTGFDAFVRDNWQSLMSADGAALRFLIPSRLADAGFRVQHVRGDQIDGMPVEVFRLGLVGIFGWFVPGIDVYYSRQDHVLMRYVGLADLLDASANNLRADISFGISARRSADDRDWVRALQAHLQPCR